MTVEMNSGTSLQIEEATVEDAGDHLLLTIRYRNTTDRTLHAYAGPRAIRYDEVTQTLIVRMTDEGLPEPEMPPPVVLPPKMVAVDPHDVRTIAVKLPRFVNRIERGEDPRVPVLVQIPTWEAQNIEVEAGWGEQPFYRDPREKGRGPMRAQLERWQRGKAAWRGGMKGGGAKAR